MKGKEILGTLSPAYGMATGKGLFGNAVGILPAIAKDMRDDREEKKKAAEVASAVEEKKPATAMKKGGYVKAADGCAKRGKTKGRMV